MAKSTGYHPGSGWWCVCDVCGFRYHADEIQQRWDGLMVCKQDMEQRHPQLNIVVRPEKIVPDFIRPETTDTFVFACDLATSSGYAGLCTAGCAKAGPAQWTYQDLLKLYGSNP
jgi:hypothetical protein